MAYLRMLPSWRLGVGDAVLEGLSPNPRYLAKSGAPSVASQVSQERANPDVELPPAPEALASVELVGAPPDELLTAPAAVAFGGAD